MHTYILYILYYTYIHTYGILLQEPQNVPVKRQDAVSPPASPASLLILLYSYTLILLYSDTLILLYAYTRILLYSYTLTPLYSYTIILLYSYTLILLHSMGSAAEAVAFK